MNSRLKSPSVTTHTWTPLDREEYASPEAGWSGVRATLHSQPEAPMKLSRPTRPRILVGIPVYNEQGHVAKVLDEVRRHAADVLVVDDGSTDCTPMLLAQQPVEVIRHAENRGYGRSMQ